MLHGFSEQTAKTSTTGDGVGMLNGAEPSHPAQSFATTAGLEGSEANASLILRSISPELPV